MAVCLFVLMCVHNVSFPRFSQSCFSGSKKTFIQGHRLSTQPCGRPGKRCLQDAGHADGSRQDFGHDVDGVLIRHKLFTNLSVTRMYANIVTKRSFFLALKNLNPSLSENKDISKEVFT